MIEIPRFYQDYLGPSVPDPCHYVTILLKEEDGYWENMAKLYLFHYPETQVIKWDEEGALFETANRLWVAFGPSESRWVSMEEAERMYA